MTDPTSAPEMRPEYEDFIPARVLDRVLDGDFGDEIRSYLVHLVSADLLSAFRASLERPTMTDQTAAGPTTEAGPSSHT